MYVSEWVSVCVCCMDLLHGLFIYMKKWLNTQRDKNKQVLEADSIGNKAPKCQQQQSIKLKNFKLEKESKQQQKQ